MRRRSARTDGDVTDVPFGRATTGTSGTVSPPPVVWYRRWIFWLASQAFCPGTVKRWFIALVAAGAATMPAMVKTTQKATTSLRWARTQRVREAMPLSTLSASSGQ